MSRPRRRGAFGLDDRRRPDPERVEAELRHWLRAVLPEIWVLPDRDGADASGCSVALLLPQGRVAMLLIARDREAPNEAGRRLIAHCASKRIPMALVSTLDEARAALRRLGVASGSALVPFHPNPFGNRRHAP